MKRHTKENPKQTKQIRVWIARDNFPADITMESTTVFYKRPEKAIYNAYGYAPKSFSWESGHDNMEIPNNKFNLKSGELRRAIITID